MGGGIHLIICDLLVKFNDPVLWFIKSLLLLYFAFYGFAYFFNKGKERLSWIVLWNAISVVCLISYLTNESFGLNSISGIPLFGIGVMSALIERSSFKYPVLPVIFSLCMCYGVVATVMAFHPRFIANLAHCTMDYAVIGLLLLAFSRFKPNVKISMLLSAITFDIYLVHFKVLLLMKSVNIEYSILMFIILTAVCAISLYFLRNKLIII